eukprot:gnl/Dysnectes_brevis/952_a1061_1539.p1 GENE.gnl/Dysnectes_brevis/952_a1061_1539~~gnl/Dysnectes_brevis/952_a1061_1539.p1  ORF type:complete len:1235 (-),score=448.51 gnl/Dysnectes_brevis/952_a1061_1539:45-3749(-)
MGCGPSKRPDGTTTMQNMPTEPQAVPESSDHSVTKPLDQQSPPSTPVIPGQTQETTVISTPTTGIDVIQDSREGNAVPSAIATLSGEQDEMFELPSHPTFESKPDQSSPWAHSSPPSKTLPTTMSPTPEEEAGAILAEVPSAATTQDALDAIAVTRTDSIPAPSPTQVKSHPSPSHDFQAVSSAMSGLDSFSKRREAREAEQSKIRDYEASQRRTQHTRAIKADELRRAVAWDAQCLADESKVSVRVILSLGPERKRALYRFHLAIETCLISELAREVANAFSVPGSALSFFFHNKLVAPSQKIISLPGYERRSLTFRCLASVPLPATPTTPLPPLKEYSPHELAARALLADGTDAVLGSTPEAPLLPHKDWLAEQRRITDAVNAGALASAEAERQVNVLIKGFNDVCRSAASLVCSGALRPTHLDGLYGCGGDCYIAGGVVLREVGDWSLRGEELGEGDVAFDAAADEANAMSWLLGAALTVHPKLVVPATCLVDFLGRRFLCYALTPADHSALRGGSNTDGLLVKPMDSDPLLALAVALNLAPHHVLPSCCDGPQLQGSRLPREELPYAPVNPQHPRAVPVALSATSGIYEADNEGILIQHASGILPPDLSHQLGLEGVVLPPLPTDPDERRLALAAQTLPPAFVAQFSKGRVADPAWVRFTSSRPVCCDCCSKTIVVYDYWTFKHKDNINPLTQTRQVVEYDVCNECYESTTNLKFARSRLKRTFVPEADRLEHWRQSTTGEVSLVCPLIKTPINPDITAPRPLEDANDHEILIEAARDLQCRAIPELVAELDSLDFVPETPSDLINEMSSRGIPVRYLGRIAAECEMMFVCEMAVREVLVRTITSLLRDDLSFLEQGEDRESLAIAAVVRFLNELFGRCEESAAEKKIWGFVEELSLRKFGYAVTADVRSKLYLLAACRAICSSVGAQLRTDVSPDFTSEAPFEPTDIDALMPVSRSFSMPPYLRSLERQMAEAEEIDNKGKGKFWYTSGGPQREHATGLLRAALLSAESIYGENSPQMASACMALASQLKSRHDEQGNTVFSRWNRSAGVPSSAFSREAIQLATRALEVRRESMEETQSGVSPRDVAECLRMLGSLKQRPTTGAPLSVMEETGIMDPNREAIEDVMSSVELLERELGFQHPQTARSYQDLALFFQEEGNPDSAAVFIRRAFVVYYIVFGSEHPLTHEVHQQLKSIEVSIDSGLESVPLDELKERIEELELEQEGMADLY